MTTSPAEPPSGLLVVDKPGGWTSHDVVAKVRRLANTRKVGHAGTLDPMATGVLLVGLGRVTRLLGYLAAESKAYDAVIRLGSTSTTDDAQGEISTAVDTSQISEGDIARVVATLTGSIQQVPSSVSAIKVAGRRAYDRVRAGEEVTLAPRAVTVHSFDVTHVQRSPAGLDVAVHVEVSSGTYVRALARDLGSGLAVGGHLTALRRTRVAGFRLNQARTLGSFENPLEPFDPQALITVDDLARETFTGINVDAEQARRVSQGQPLDWPVDASMVRPIAAFDPAGRVVALLEPSRRLDEGNLLRILVGLRS